MSEGLLRRSARAGTALMAVSAVVLVAVGCGTGSGGSAATPPPLSVAPGPSAAPAAPEPTIVDSGIVARAVSTAYPVEGRNMRLVRRGDEVVLQFEMFNGMKQSFKPIWAFEFLPPMMLVDLPRSMAYMVPTKVHSNDSLVSMNTVDGIPGGSSSTITARFNAPQAEASEMLVVVDFLRPVMVPIQPEGAAVRDDPVFALVKSPDDPEERVVSCSVKGADGAPGKPTPVEVRLPSDVLFEFGSATLSPAAQAAIGGVKGMFGSNGGAISVEGHTDAIGDDASNLRLSEQRAAAVRDALAAQLGSGFTFTPVGFGETKPIAPNQKADGSDDPNGRAQNRRVEVRLGTVVPGAAPALRPVTMKTVLADAGLQVEVGALRRMGGFLLADLTVRNPTPLPIQLPTNNGLVGNRGAPGGMSLADRQAQRRYELCSALETGDGQTIGNTGNYYSPIKFDMLPAGAAVSFWALYLAPPAETTTMDVEIGGFGTVQPSPISF